MLLDMLLGGEGVSHTLSGIGAGVGVGTTNTNPVSASVSTNNPNDPNNTPSNTTNNANEGTQASFFRSSSSLNRVILSDLAEQRRNTVINDAKKHADDEYSSPQEAPEAHEAIPPRGLFCSDITPPPIVSNVMAIPILLSVLPSLSQTQQVFVLNTLVNLLVRDKTLANLSKSVQVRVH